jgi:hypothetical protein
MNRHSKRKEDVMPLLEVRRYAVRKRHGGLFWRSSIRYEPDGRKSVVLSRAYCCTCGEELRDGDRLVGTARGVTHVNCARWSA